MMKSMKKALTVLLAALMTVAALSGCAGSGDAVVATVYGEKITVDEFNTYLAQTKTEMEKELNPDGNKDFWNTEAEGKMMIDVAKDKALGELIKEKVQLQKAKETGITLSSEDQQQVTQQKRQVMDNAGGRDAYLENLSKSGYTDATFTEMLRNLMLIEKLKEQTSGEEGFVTEEDVNAYIAENAAEFEELGKKVTAKHILISTQDESGNPLPEDQKEEKKAKAEALLAELKDGADFDTLMMENTEDPGITQNPDGYTFGKGEMVEEFETAAFALGVDEMSDLVESDFGYHIIKVTNITKDETEAVSAAREALSEEKYDALVEEWRQAAEGEIEIDEEVLASVK